MQDPPIENQPSPDEVTDALTKGLGRAYVWAKVGEISTECLLDACLSDYRFDRQFEDVRGGWLWQILIGSSTVDYLRDTILDALKSITDSDAEAQLCQLAQYYALAGDDRFTQQLRRIVIEKPVPQADLLGEEELIAITGTAGFLDAVRSHGEDLADRDWEWYDTWLADLAVERWGKVHVVGLLESASVGDRSVRIFRDAWKGQPKIESGAGSSAYRQQLAETTVDEIVQAAESGSEGNYRFRGWGRQASESDLTIVYDRMLHVSDADVLQRYLQVFAMRTWPRFDHRLIELCLNEDEKVRRRAVTAVANNSHPVIRDFAIECLSEPEYQGDAIDLLVKNYEQGDENMILQQLILPEGGDQLHWVLMSLRTLIGENQSAKTIEATQLVYNQTPCSFCRNSMLRLKKSRGGLPEEMAEECQFDVEVDTRELVGGPIWD